MNKLDLDLNFNNEVVKEYVNNLIITGSLSNFLEQCVGTLLRGGILTETGKDLMLSGVDNSFLDSDLDNDLDNLLSVEENIDSISDTDVKDDEDIFGDLDDVEDEENDFDVPLPTSLTTDKPTEEEINVEVNENKKIENTSNEIQSELNLTDREFMLDLSNKLDRLLSLAESGGFSPRKTSQVAPLNLNIKPKEPDTLDVIDAEEEVSLSEPNSSVNDMLGSLSLEKILEINNKLSGR